MVAKASAEGSVVKKTAKKSSLRAEIERISKATGLPQSFIRKRLKGMRDQQKKDLVAFKAAQVSALQSQVAELGERLKNVMAPPSEMSA